jgi:tetratricopeptide (TPR) repeat protein
MKADQAFDLALGLDPLNWEARYTKALAMSYWPSELNKGQEVITQFRSLIEQQEAQAPQPEFERSYLRLGEEYEKAGRNDYALQVWQRGIAWFPESQDLKKKLDSKR